MSYRNSNCNSSNYRRSYKRGRTQYSNKEIVIKTVDVQVNDNTFGVKVSNPATPTTTDPATGGISYLINGLVQGTTSFQRVGITITPRSIRVRGSFGPNGPNDFPGPTIRCAVVYDLSPVGAVTAAYTDIFQGFDVNGNPVVTATVSPNPSNLGRFSILMDEFVQLGFVGSVNGAVFSTSPAQFTVNKYIKASWNFHKKQVYEVQYKNVVGGGSGTQSDLSTGAYLFVIYNSSNGAQTASSAGPGAPPADVPATMSCNVTIRFSYRDK